MSKKRYKIDTVKNALVGKRITKVKEAKGVGQKIVLESGAEIVVTDDTTTWVEK
jgi:hypothetical protein